MHLHRRVGWLLLSVGTTVQAGSSNSDPQACIQNPHAEDMEDVGLAQLRFHVTHDKVQDKGITFSSNDAEFDKMVKNAEGKVLAEGPDNFAHEAPVYLPEHNKVLFISNRYACEKPGQYQASCKRVDGGTSVNQFATIQLLDLNTNVVELLPYEVWGQQIVMGNGAYPDDGCDKVFITSQGLMDKRGGVYRLDIKTGHVESIISSSSFMGDQFNSPNDIVVDPISKALVFTDPQYGFEQGFRPVPEIGNWVWVYRMESGTDRPRKLKLAADGFTKPNGIAWASEKADKVYVTDTGYFRGNEWLSAPLLKEAVRTHDKSASVFSNLDRSAPRTVYAFDVERDEAGNIQGFGNRRIVFSAEEGAPDGIKVDCAGRIYTGQADGVAVHDDSGKLLGVIDVPEGTANLVLIPRGEKTELIIMAETKIYSVTLNTKTCVIAR